MITPNTNANIMVSQMVMHIIKDWSIKCGWDFWYPVTTYIYNIDITPNHYIHV